jgi:hypothetical protein
MLRSPAGDPGALVVLLLLPRSAPAVATLAVLAHAKPTQARIPVRLL